MNYIIDGYNLAFKIAPIAQTIKSGNTDKAIRQLTNYVSQKLNSKNTRIIIVFDGKHNDGNNTITVPGAKLMFSKKPQTADDIIRNFVRTTNNIKLWTIVSSDNEIIYTAQDHGAQTLKSHDFIRITSKKKTTPMDSKEKNNPQNVDIDYWKKMFDAPLEEDEF